MEPVVIAAGSNLGNRQAILQKAGDFLESLSEGAVKKSSVWESEPVGPALYPFLNSVIKIESSMSAVQLLTKLKSFEIEMGREANSERWSPRILDLDIIGYGGLVIHSENLIIPHPEYTRRLFVLLPVKEVDPEWTDPLTGSAINDILDEAPDMKIIKTNLNW